MPTDRLTPGLKTETVTIVDDKLVVKHMGGDGVLSTPSMIALMERASIQAVQDYLPEGHTTVGFEVHVKHFGATPKGKKVTVRAELIEVDGRKPRFKVEAHDEDKQGWRWHPSARDHCRSAPGLICLNRNLHCRARRHHRRRKRVRELNEMRLM